MSNTLSTPTSASTIAQARINWNDSIEAVATNFSSRGQPAASSILWEGVALLKEGMSWYKGGANTANGEGRLLVYNGSTFTRNGIGTYQMPSLSAAITAATSGKIAYGDLVLVGNNRLYMVSSSGTSLEDIGTQPAGVPAPDSALLDGLDSSQFFRSDIADTMEANARFNANVHVIGRLGVGTATPGYNLDVVGNVYASIDIITGSDARYKSNVAIIPDAINVINQLRGVSFTHNNSNINSFGFIAQEVEPILPQVVKHDKDYLGLNYTAIIPILVEAVKQQQKEIERLNGILQNTDRQTNS